MEVDENYFIDVDLSENPSVSVVTVYKQCGSSVKIVNSFTGKEAEHFRKILTGEEKLIDE